MFDRNFWISGLRGIAWLVFGIIVLAGIILGVSSGNFFLFLLFVALSAVIAFLSVASIMIVLNAAEDIADIKDKLYENSVSQEQTSVMRKALQKAEFEKHEEQILSNNGWKCSSCGKANPRSTGTCSCGNSRYSR